MYISVSSIIRQVSLFASTRLIAISTEVGGSSSGGSTIVNYYSYYLDMLCKNAILICYDKFEECIYIYIHMKFINNTFT